MTHRNLPAGHHVCCDEDARQLPNDGLRTEFVIFSTCREKECRMNPTTLSGLLVLSTVITATPSVFSQDCSSLRFETSIPDKLCE